jgi:hypothetical protein
MLPEPLRSVVAGASGTAVMSAAYTVERRLRHSGRHTPLDYDDSLVPGEIVANILHLGQVSGRADEELGLGLRWGYGSAFGLWHGVLRSRMEEPAASLAFGATLMTATLTLFPLLGRTPPPWRWPKGYMLTCLFTHAAYVTACGVVDDRLR